MGRHTDGCQIKKACQVALVSVPYPVPQGYIHQLQGTYITIIYTRNISMYIYKQAELIMGCLVLLPHDDSLLSCAVTHSSPTPSSNFAHCL